MIEKEINLEKVKLDLEVTLLGDVERNDGVSTLTTEEKMNLFPEINGDKTLLKTLEKSIVSNNEVLKKKNNIPFSYNSTDESSTSQSGTPSTLEATTTETDKIVEPTTQEINSNTVDSESQTQEINTQTIEVEETKLVDETIEETVVEEEVVEETVVEETVDLNLTETGFRTNKEIDSDIVNQFNVSDSGEILKNDKSITGEVPGTMGSSNVTGVRVEGNKIIADVKAPFGMGGPQDLGEFKIGENGEYTWEGGTNYERLPEQEKIEMDFFISAIESDSVFAQELLGAVENNTAYNTSDYGYTKQDVTEEVVEEEVTTEVTEEVVNQITGEVTTEVTEVPNQDVADMNTFHKGKGTEGLEQAFDDYPTLALYDLYQVPINLKVDKQEKLYDLKDEETINIPGTTAIAQPIVFEPIIAPEINTVDVNVNDILMNHNNNINGENAVDWVPTNERDYGQEELFGTHVLNQRAYGMGLDNKTINYEFDEDGNNVIYIAGQKEDGSIDYENRTILSSFKEGEGEGSLMYSVESLFDDEDKQNIYKGIAYQMHLQGQELTPGAIGYLVDSQYNQYKALVNTHYTNLYSQINKKALNYEEEFTFEDYKEFLPEAKTNLIKDLISKNIFLPGVIHGNDFEKMVYDKIYQERTNRYVDKVMVDVQELVDDPENYKGVFFPNIDDDDYNVGSVGTTGPFVLYQTRAEDIDIFRQAIELELDKDKYDWMGKSDKDAMGGMLTRKWKMTHSDFSAIHSKNEDLEIEKFNEKIETSEIESELEDNENVGEVEPKITFIKPGEVEEVVGAEVAELIKNGMSITDIDIYVNEKYGLNYDNETSSLKFSPKYIKAHGQIYQEINKHTFDEFNELHPEMNNKHLGLEAWEGTVGGMIFGYDNPDYDVKYNWHEENIIIPVLSIVGDPFTYITGGAGGFAGKSMVGMARTRHLQHMKTSVQMLVNTGKYTVQEANILVKANNAKLYNRIIKSEGIVTSGLGLGLYTTTAEIAMHSTENFDDMYVGEVIKNGLVNTALGGGIGHIHGLSSRVKGKIDRLFGKNNNQFKTTFNDGLKLELNVPNKISTLNNMAAWTGGRATETVALGLESGLFMSAHYDKTKSLSENYRDNVVFLFSLKTAMSTMKLGAKPDGSKMKYKEDFKVNNETLDHINRQFNGTQKFKNSGELYDYLDKEMKGSLTNNKKGELDMNKITELQSILSSLPLDVQYKYLDSRNFSVDMELPDLIPMHMESVTIEGKESIVYSNHRGEVIEVRNAKDVAELSSGEMTTSQYMDKVFETSSRRLAEHGIKEDKYVEDLYKKLKSHNVTPDEYKQWFNGTMGKGQKYENLELSKKISNLVNNQFQQKSLETSKALESFSSDILTQSISNLKDRGVAYPNARAIANECLSVQNKFFERERAVNSEKTRLIEQEIKHIDNLEKNKHIQGYEHTNENGDIVYTNTPTGKVGERSVTTNITADNKVYIGELLGAELTIGNKSRVINALKESNKLTPELENLINETTTLKELQKIVKDNTNIESLEYKTYDQHLEFSINGENNSTVVLTGEKTTVESRQVTSFDVLTSENSESLLKQATTPAHRQMIEDGLIVLQKLSEKGVESKVTMHNSQESFLKVLENDGMTVESNKYAATAYVDKKGNMHFNTKVTREKTDVYHEYQHLELDVLKNKSPEKYKQYIEEVNTLLENEGALAHILAIVDAKDNQGNKIYTVEETSKDGGVSTNLEKTIEYRGEEALIRIAEAVRNGTIDPKSLDAIKNSSILNKMKIKINESLNSLGSSSKLKTSVEVLEYISNHVKDFESTKITSEKTTTKSTDLETVGEGEGKLKVTEKFEDIKDVKPSTILEENALLMGGDKLKQVTIEKGGETYRVTIKVDKDGRTINEKTERLTNEKDWVEESTFDHEPYSKEYDRINAVNKTAEQKYEDLVESNETSVKEKGQNEINETIPEPSKGYVKPEVINPHQMKDNIYFSQSYKGSDMKTYGEFHELPSGKWVKTGKEHEIYNQFGVEGSEFILPKEAQKYGDTKVAVVKWEKGDWRTIEYNGEGKYWTEIGESRSFKTKKEAEFNILKEYGERVELTESQKGEGKLKVTEKVSNLTSEKELLETADLETLTSTERTKIENRIKAIDAELDVLKVKETVVEETIEPTPKRLETLVEELETLKSEGASQEAIDAKFQEINSARVKQAQAELGPEVGETIEARDARELSEITPQEVFNTSRDLLNNTDLKETKTINDVTGLEEVKGYNVETQKLIQNLKEVKFNPESKNVEVLTAEYNNIVKKISDGTATPKEINDSFIKINNLEKGEVIVTNLTSSLEKHGGAIRGLSGLTSGNTNLQGTVIGGTGKIGGIEIKTKEMLDRDLSTLNLSMIEGYLYMEKGGEITKNIVGPIQEAHVEYNLNVRKNTTDWFENTSMKNPIRRKKTMTKMGLLLSQKERNSIDGKNVWLEILEGKDAGGNYDRGYSKKEKTRIQKEYDKLPKLEDGSIDMVKAFESLSVTERKILETYENMTSELREKQKIVNEINGKDFVDIENYFPHLSKIKFEKGQEVTTKSSNKEFLDELYDGELNTKIKSDRGIERTAEGVLPMEFNLDKVMINLIGETSRDHAYSGTLKEVNSLITSMKGGENADVNLVLTAIQKRVNDGVKLQLHTNNGFISKVGKPLFNVNYATQLISVRRLFFVEPLSESLRMVTTRPREQYPDFFKQFGEGSNRRLKNMLGGDNTNIPFNIMERTGSTGLMKANKIGMEYNQPGRLNTMDKANNYLLGMIDRSQINIVWMPAFKAEFKKSGKEFNVKEYKANPDAYFEANARIFKESSRMADRELGKWKNESTIGGKRTNIDILGLTTLETSSEWAPIMTYMSNFGAQEVAMMQKGLKDLVRGDNAETRAQSVREVLGVFSSGVVYGIASGVGYGFQQYYTERKLLENQLGDGDYDQREIRGKISTLDAKWEQEYSDMTNPESIKKEMITNGMFLATSKYSQAVKVVLGSSLGVMDNITSSEQFQVLGGNQAVGLDWLEYSKELFSDATYSKIPKNPEDILMNMLPQIEMAWDVFNEDAPQAVLDYISRGEYLADFEEEYKEDINMYNFLSTSLKVALFSVGKALPFQKDIDQTLKSMYNFYGVNIQENRKLINTIKNTSGSQTQEYSGGPEKYIGGPEKYIGGPEQSTAGNLPVISDDEGGKTTKEKRENTTRSREEKYPHMVGTHSLSREEFKDKYGENFRWWDYSGDELKEIYSQEDCKEFLPYTEYNKLFPEDAY